MAAILMMPSQLVALGLLKMKVFWNKGYNVIIFIYEASNKVLSRDANSTLDVIIWLKFGNSSISIREVFITSIL